MIRIRSGALVLLLAVPWLLVFAVRGLVAAAQWVGGTAQEAWAAGGEHPGLAAAVAGFALACGAVLWWVA